MVIVAIGMINGSDEAIGITLIRANGTIAVDMIATSNVRAAAIMKIGGKDMSAGISGIITVAVIATMIVGKANGACPRHHSLSGG
ncbi:MAG: hypothetical protein HYR55_11695 [Acidobacteria bacterium]|nr:hypothetical protein [Acidobacteriota bacterium]MBI3657252.1 hypothetical protein [Acidobacteriota bacterium]